MTDKEIEHANLKEKYDASKLTLELGQREADEKAFNKAFSDADKALTRLNDATKADADATKKLTEIETRITNIAANKTAQEAVVNNIDATDIATMAIENETLRQINNNLELLYTEKTRINLQSI